MYAGLNMKYFFDYRFYYIKKIGPTTGACMMCSTIGLVEEPQSPGRVPQLPLLVVAGCLHQLPQLHTRGRWLTTTRNLVGRWHYHDTVRWVRISTYWIVLRIDNTMNEACEECENVSQWRKCLEIVHLVSNKQQGNNHLCFVGLIYKSIRFCCMSTIPQFIQATKTLIGIWDQFKLFLKMITKNKKHSFFCVGIHLPIFKRMTGIMPRP